MQHVCVLISKPGSATLDREFIEQVCDLLGARFSGQWLCPHEAFEFDVGNVNAQDIKSDKLLDRKMRALIGERPVDIAFVPVNHRRKHLLIADMDSTLIEQECIDELGAALGIKDLISAITARAMSGEIDFDNAVRERVALLTGLNREQIADVIRDRITMTPGARTLVQTMRSAGAHTALVSGGFTLFTEQISSALGFHTHQANVLNFDGDRLSGTVQEPILGQDAKRVALNRFVREHHLMVEQALAVGDGANDLAMINAAGLGVAFRAKPIVAAAADAQINHGDLTALLYLQGYTSDEFVSPH